MRSELIHDEEGLRSLRVLLKESHLPYNDLTLDKNLFVRYENAEGLLIGSGGLEIYGSYALLRSIAVDETLRGRSLGTEIVNDLLLKAKEKSIKAIYLLTETAHDFFIRKGFKDIQRSEVPAEVTASSEFTSVLPGICGMYGLCTWLIFHPPIADIDSVMTICFFL